MQHTKTEEMDTAFKSIVAPPITVAFSSHRSFSSFPFPFRISKLPYYFTTEATRKSSSNIHPLLQPSLTAQQHEQNFIYSDDEDEVEEYFLEDEDEDEEYFLEDEDEDEQVYAGDGGEGGGVRLAGTWWDKEALSIAEKVCQSFHGEFGIYAFKTLSNNSIQLRIQSLTNKSGSPTMEDIEAFSATYRTRLDEAELAKTIPNLAIELSSPGVERVVQIPEELDRFKDRNLYVKYVSEKAGTDAASEGDGVFRLITLDMETKCCTWGLADVRINREKAGKGRPLSKKQREWRLNTLFESLRLVRLYSEI